MRKRGQPYTVILDPTCRGPADTDLTGFGGHKYYKPSVVSVESGRVLAESLTKRMGGRVLPEEERRQLPGRRAGTPTGPTPSSAASFSGCRRVPTRLPPGSGSPRTHLARRMSPRRSIPRPRWWSSAGAGPIRSTALRSWESHDCIVVSVVSGRQHQGGRTRASLTGGRYMEGHAPAD